MNEKIDNNEQIEDRSGSEEKEIGGIDKAARTLGVNQDELRTVDAGLSPDEVESQFTEAEGKAIMKKIDMRLIPLLAFLYL